MPRNYTTKTRTYDERLALWQSGECPYCGSPLVTVANSRRGGKHYTCHQKKCRAQNHFSRKEPALEFEEDAP